MNLSLDPTNLKIKGVLMNGTVFATTNGQLVLEWKAIDYRDTEAKAVSAPSKITIDYACDTRGLSTGSLIFKDND